MLSPGNFTVKKRRIVRFEGLTKFKWSDLGEQDVVGQSSFGAVFVTKYLDRNSSKPVVVKKLFGSSLQFIDA
ncbi:unnamed protein product [Porites lobata]|uniref:Uncharacterized protein n=1 Tax=Porites lobata TaxID=104759 RepID=A0ABN8RET8_9CNID|nr:unnamed protein product [Porites lobata]